MQQLEDTMNEMQKHLEEQGFAKDQIEEMRKGAEAGLDVKIYARKEFLAIQMQQIRLGLMKKLPVEVYAKTEYDWFQMEEIRKGLETGLDVSYFESPMYTALEMKKRRIFMKKYPAAVLMEEIEKPEPVQGTGKAGNASEHYEITISEDEMEAYIMMHGSSAEFDRIDIVKVLQEKGVSKEGKYFGVVTVKDLLEATVAIEAERATDANPLTHLPGNQLILEEIEHRLNGGEKFSVMYLDLDNFKAYNDAYGFENGDLMIKALADSMKLACQDNEFLGHVGGDDFVILSEHYHMREVYERIISRFHHHLKELYTPEDYEKKEIVSKNRHGEVEVFPLASISCALLSNELVDIQGMDDFSKKIARLKKESKQRQGDSLFEYGVDKNVTCY